MNGRAMNPRQLQEAMQRLAQENHIRQQSLALFLGLSGVAMSLLGMTMVKCSCMQPGCSGHAIQFDNRAHFTQQGIVMIPRAGVAPAVNGVIPEAAGGPPAQEPVAAEDETPSVIIKP